jgi:hypothetical protein
LLKYLLKVGSNFVHFAWMKVNLRLFQISENNLKVMAKDNQVNIAVT